MGEIHYQPLLVALSYVISVLGSYTALRLAVAIPQAQDRVSAMGWTLGAATALGGGAIWSMHFIGMNAADMGVPVAYDATLTFTSLLLAIVAPGVGLYMVGRGQGSVVKLVLAGIFTGLGVAVMHYTGMAAMILPATINYDPNLFNLSLVIAVAAATVAFWLAFNLRGNLQRFGSALVMGVAVCGMHYTGMYAVRLDHTAQASGTGVYLPPSAMAYTIFAITAVLMLLLLVFNAWRVQQEMSEEIA